MILIDSRVGSAHYHDLIPNSVLTQLESADVCFEGNGVTVGIEVKKLLDAVNCMYTGRLADHQIPLMKAQYDVCYLVVEGIWRPEPGSGVLQYLKLFKENENNFQGGKWMDASSGMKRLMYSAFESWLATLSIEGGVWVRSTSCMETTAALIMSMYSWWQRSSHHSFHVMDETTGERAVLSRPTMLRRMIYQIPRVGWDRSGILAPRFTGVRFLPNGDDPAAWYIENQIAEGTARKIVEACGVNK